MKLYSHPVSSTCRPVLLFLADHSMQVENQTIDLMSGEQYGEAYCAINPNSQVPTLEDGDFRLTESAAILRYLAEQVDSPTYPRAAQQRARVNELLDWLNTGFYREYGYHLIYPQIFEHFRRADMVAQTDILERGKQGSERYLGVLDKHWLGRGNSYLCGNELTIADYFGAAILSAGELIGCRFGAFPNVERWYARMRDRSHWNEVNEAFYGVVKQLEGQQFVRL